MKVIIKNLILNKEIVFPNSSHIIVHPHNYDEEPYIEIKIGCDFNFLRHARECEDCGSFINSFGTNTLNWYVLFNQNKYRLDMSGLGGTSKNIILYKTSTYEFGSTLKLFFSKIPTDIDELEKHLLSLVETENYESACDIRDLIKIEKNMN
jgi:hypothetical protein